MRGQVVLLAVAFAFGIAAWQLGAVSWSAVVLAALALAFAVVALLRTKPTRR